MNYQNEMNLQNIEELLKKSIATWRSGAPALNDYYAKEIGILFRYKSKKVMDAAYRHLFNTHKGRFFPDPIEWKQALAYGQEVNQESGSGGEWLDLTRVGTQESGFRFITKLDKAVIDLVKNFSNSCWTDKAKEQGYWDKIREDYSFSFSGFTAYVAEIFKAQFAILNKITAPISVSAEYSTYCKSAEFREKVLKNGFVCPQLLREKDIEAFRVKGLEMKELLKNSSFAKYSDPERLIKGLGKNLKQNCN